MTVFSVAFLDLAVAFRRLAERATWLRLIPDLRFVRNLLLLFSEIFERFFKIFSNFSWSRDCFNLEASFLDETSVLFIDWLKTFTILFLFSPERPKLFM